MQSQIDSLIASTHTADHHHQDRFQFVPSSERLLIAVAGIPGSGKTTLAAKVVKGINAHFDSEVAAMIPMDGYHLTRTQLSALPDPDLAHFRRGAHWTFSPTLLLSLLTSLRAPLPQPTIYAASFSHSLKDPIENDIAILPSHRILVFEGNYLALKEPEEWRKVAEVFDETWFVECEENVAKERLARRHVEAGICGTLEEGVRRAEGNDLVNGRWLVENRGKVDRWIRSEEDEGFRKDD